MREGGKGFLAGVAGAAVLSLLCTVQRLLFGFPFTPEGYVLPALAGAGIGLWLRHWYRQWRRAQERNQNTRLMLQTLRALNRLLLETRERGELLQGICATLVDKRHYFNAWLMLFDRRSGLTAAAQAGLGERFELLRQELLAGRRPSCIEKALASDQVLVVEEPPLSCPDCPLAAEYAGRAGLVTRISHQDMVYGVICVSVAVSQGVDPEEHQLLREIARDVGQALYHQQLEAERFKVQEAAQRQMEELFAIFNAIEGAVYVADMETYELLAVTASSLAEYGGQELVGQKCYQRLQVGQEGPCSFCTNPLLVGPDNTPNPPVVWEFQNTRTGNWYLCIDRAIHWPDGRLVRMEIAINISDRKRAEEALRRSEKNFRELVENSQAGILLIQDGTIIYQNPEQRRLFGLLPPSFRLEEFPGLHPDDRDKVRQAYERIISGAASGQDLDFRFYPLVRKKGEPAMRWVYCRARRIDYQDRQTILVSMMDISRAKELEQLVRVQDKMTSLGRVAAGIAHEIRNPLSGINIYLDTLERIFDQPERRDKVIEIFHRLAAASRKIEAVIRRVMDFSRPGQPHFQAMDVRGPIQAALELAGVTLRKQEIVLETELEAELPLCRLDPDLLEQVIMNLLTNSAEALKEQPQPRRILVAAAVEGKEVVVRVADSGPGIPEARRQAVFDPFFTTKEGGTGIGLSICHRIVDDHGGRLEAGESRWGGAEFVVRLPVLGGEETR